MLKKILIAILIIALLCSCGFGVWFFLFRMQSLRGDISHAYAVTLYIKDGVTYDVWVPNEAELIETDQASLYRFDLLTVGVQDIEPTAKYKVPVEGRWVYAKSEDNWLSPTAWGFEHEEAKHISPRYRYTEVVNEETGEVTPAVWDDGTLPPCNIEPTLADYDVDIDGTDYIIYGSTYGVWEDTRDNLLARLCSLSDDYVPHYYDDGRLFYAECGDYCVGMKYTNFNTNETMVAHGSDFKTETLALLHRR